MKRLEKLFQQEGLSNSIHTVRENEADEVDKRLGIRFPKDLRTFWDRFGYAFIRQGFKNETEVDSDNRILTPIEIESLVTKANDCGYVAPGEGFREGCVPFLHINSSSFFQVDAKSVVYGIDQKKEADDLASFFDRMADDATLV